MALNRYRSRLLLCSAILVGSVSEVPALDDPFLPGAAMASLGTIAAGYDIPSRQPWLPASLMRDSLAAGVAVAVVDYYDPMDNLTDRHIWQGLGGAFYSRGWGAAKVSCAFYDILGCMYEQRAQVSAALRPGRRFSVGLDIAESVAGLYGVAESAVARGGLSVSAVAWFRSAVVSASAQNLVEYEATQESFTCKSIIRAGICSAALGSHVLGAAIEYHVGASEPIRFFLGQEYRPHQTVGLFAAVGTNPFLFACGCTLSFADAGMYTSFVNHPVLGWSKSIGGEWKAR